MTYQRTVKVTLIRLFAVSCLLFTPLAFAQMKSDPTGTWGGTMTTDVGTSGMEITLTRAAAGWTATMKLRLPQGQEIAPLVQKLEIKGADISFNAQGPLHLVKFVGKFAGDNLTGPLDVYDGETKIRSGNFALTFGGAMPAPQQPPAAPGQVADPNFDTTVARPAYKRRGPKVLFDEAHNNFHTASGRYKPFADLITNDGYQVVPNKQPFTREALAGHKILVISNALGAPAMNAPDASKPAFTEAESDAVRDWVRGGGSLLLIADHAPMGAANQILGQRFGVDMRNAFTVDPKNSDKESQNPGFIVYTRESGRLADHPVTTGRNASERVNKVIAFTGQSLKGPADSIAFMKLADSARDTMPGRNTNPPSAAGRAQGIAMKVGKGRVIVLGEAAMMSAQIGGPQQMKFGMNRPGIDNRQLALNIMHWLSGKI